MKKLLLLVGATCALVAIIGTNKAHANIPPANTSMADVIEVSGLPNGNGKYWRWYGAPNETGWLKRNPDGSSFQLIAKYFSDTGLSRTMNSLILYDTKNNSSQALLPISRAGNRSWVLSWLDPSFNIINRNHQGTFYGQKGVPGTAIVKSATGAAAETTYDLSLSLIRGPRAPGPSGGTSLGTYQLTLVSNKNLPTTELEIMFEIDDINGKTVFSEPMRVDGPMTTKEFTREIILEGPMAILADGKYTLNVELRNRRNRNEFLAGTTKVMEVKTTTGRIGSTILGSNIARATISVGHGVHSYAVADATARLEALARIEFAKIAETEKIELNRALSAHGPSHSISFVNTIVGRSLYSVATGYSTAPRIDETLENARRATYGILKSNGYITSIESARKVLKTADGIVTIDYSFLWKPLNTAAY